MYQKIFIKKIKTHKDRRGYFQEILKSEVKYKQVSYSNVKKNVIKGWHGHKKQNQWTFFLRGKAQVLIKYKGIIIKFTISHINPHIYYLPKNYFHSYKVLSDYADVIYITSGKYDPKNDELREHLDKNIFFKNFK